jgi:hypothetical protein
MVYVNAINPALFGLINPFKNPNPAAEDGHSWPLSLLRHLIIQA